MREINTKIDKALISTAKISDAATKAELIAIETFDKFSKSFLK